ncbi:flagellin A1 [Salinarchaeum sp. Harcht-Bsk1]|uniref:archaellin/type IV pilin N-terminal domain-containing protein n=1 Tax=Salinarchaeum sp. Harcht-Bsk1 TaxID=1333523 RepID=UPI0003423F57|nr:archaellin/type IV pilin N-terminal domain-containing protein [Salinarchaeum sp. Harcht-Bsk1]AGN02335.1 flagellin A1 [Salinarchaeum sp. Harcht-Bsk1]
MKLIPNEDDRGQVGIGTLIVFIAMVLVAAIAAGVLINTAGFLQDQAENTGTESTAQVANNLQVQTQTGIVNNAGTGDNISEIHVGVQPAAGAEAINLEELTIQYNNENSTNFIHNDSTNDGVSNTFTTTAVSAEDGSDNVMSQSGDFYEIVLDLSATNSTANLEPSEEAEVTITTPQGSQTVVTLRAPDSLATADPGETVELR